MLILATLSIPAVRIWLESSMVSHVLIELPLLIVGGMLVGGFALERYPALARVMKKYSAAALFAALFTFLYWMLPQSLDASLSDPDNAVMKFISLPVLLGVPLASPELQTSPIIKGFVICNLISMLLVMGWLYMTAPMQLCNYYVQGEQQQLGQLLVLIAGITSLYWASRAMRSAR